jgi:hypothetical protein
MIGIILSATTTNTNVRTMLTITHLRLPVWDKCQVLIHHEVMLYGAMRAFASQNNHNNPTVHFMMHLVVCRVNDAFSGLRSERCI